MRVYLACLFIPTILPLQELARQRVARARRGLARRRQLRDTSSTHTLEWRAV